MIVFTITVINIVSDPVLGVRQTPAIFTSLPDAIRTVRNNDNGMSDEGFYQYAVVEETLLNKVYPRLYDGVRLWFKYNAVLDEFEPCDSMSIPKQLRNLCGFGIG